PSTRAERCRQTDDAGSVSGPVAAVDVVAAEGDPGQFPGQVIHFVGRLGAAEDAERVGAVGGEIPLEPFRGAVERLVPGCRLQHPVLPDQRFGEPDVTGRVLMSSHANLRGFRSKLRLHRGEVNVFGGVSGYLTMLVPALPWRAANPLERCA